MRDMARVVEAAVNAQASSSPAFSNTHASSSPAVSNAHASSCLSAGLLVTEGEVGKEGEIRTAREARDSVDASCDDWLFQPLMVWSLVLSAWHHSANSAVCVENECFFFYGRYLALYSLVLPAWYHCGPDCYPSADSLQNTDTDTDTPCLP